MRSSSGCAAAYGSQYSFKAEPTRCSVIIRNKRCMRFEKSCDQPLKTRGSITYAVGLLNTTLRAPSLLQGSLPMSQLLVD
jgi:hypothetical protein